MARHQLCVDTARNLLDRKRTLSWRALAQELGYETAYAASLSAAARRIPGAMSRAAENDLRQRLGLPVRQSPYKSVALPAALRDGLNEQRKAHGLTWAELLSTLETQ